MGKIAFIFSGQGAQYTGMGKELYEISKAAKGIFDMADEIRANTSRQCFEAPKDVLSQTINTQPDLFCVDLAAACALRENGLIPDVVAGFSLGEIPALAFSGALGNEEAFRLVCKRAEFMEQCALENKGEMLAVLGISSDKVEELCGRLENVYPVNYNCETQTVAAGSPESIEQLAAAAKESGAKAVKLAVSGAFHSPYMNEASEKMRNYLKDIELSDFNMPVYSNFSSEIYNDKYLIAEQINHPVKWYQIINKMINDGVDTFIEVGAGKVLTGLMKKISGDIKAYHIEDEKTLAEVLDNVKK